MEVYIDDMLVKSQQSGDHISHLSDTFRVLQKFNIKLNPEKFAFGVSLGKFLGFLVSNRRSEVNTTQIKVIEEIPDMLTTLKKQDQFEWSEECQQALKNLKTYLSNPSLLAKPNVGERLLIYLAIPRDENVKADTLANLASAADVTSNENASYGTVPEDKKKSSRASKKGCSILFKVRQSLSKNDRCTLSKVPRAFSNGICNERDTRGALWKSHKRAITDRITSTPYHLVGNGQAESTNKVIVNNLKKRLEESKGNWSELLPGVLWAYHTTTKTSTGETPISLVYGAEALIPVEIGEPSMRYT
uniref:Uncharacterized protein LOC104249760 n=1 Tax=Nicotiana sylvestris TaxID=4096 RepID=A0A1U7YN74_NICSY|nr:PREDICTED: uncharacterized protein LOC104249760 [Nicotiana sylvestris]